MMTPNELMLIGYDAPAGVLLETRDRILATSGHDANTRYNAAWLTAYAANQEGNERLVMDAWDYWRSVVADPTTVYGNSDRLMIGSIICLVLARVVSRPEQQIDEGSRRTIARRLGRIGMSVFTAYSTTRGSNMRTEFVVGLLTEIAHLQLFWRPEAVDGAPNNLVAIPASPAHDNHEIRSHRSDLFVFGERNKNFPVSPVPIQAKTSKQELPKTPSHKRKILHSAAENFTVPKGDVQGRDKARFIVDVCAKEARGKKLSEAERSCLDQTTAELVSSVVDFSRFLSQNRR